MSPALAPDTVFLADGAWEKTLGDSATFFMRGNLPRRNIGGRAKAVTSPSGV